MKQVFLSGKGQIEVIETPVPGRLRGSSLVRNAFSVISSGTEGAAVTRREGVAGLYEKVLKSRDRLDQVWTMARNQGLGSTLALVQNKLADYTPIGYSSAGVVLETDEGDGPFRPGDRVACMGAGFANHAEYVTGLRNLSARVPDGVPLEEAAFGAIACIAMQGIRRLELSPGEHVAVIGLGLIGQIAYRLATAMGYQAHGYDIDATRTAHANENGRGCGAVNSREIDAVAHAREGTGGFGADGVLVCASGTSDEIVNQALAMCRQRGRVSIVGDVGLSLQRARMYAKELEVRLSCSYGVGRYDPEYELLGHDYPLGHVRWTEKRNLEHFLAMLAQGRLSLGDLVSRKVGIAEARDAYALIKSGRTDIYGVLLDYGTAEPHEVPKGAFRTGWPVRSTGGEKLRIGLIGVGAYAKNVHLPNLQRIDEAVIRGIASRSGATAAIAARKVGGAYASSDARDVITDPEIDAVVISTRHASHASFVLAALKADKHVFVEKPMATSVADCLAIVEAARASGRVLRVGFNRRFAPMLVAMKSAVGRGRRTFTARVNVGAMAEHWSNTVEEGGRLMGEGVHFFDLANWVMDEEPVSVSAQFAGEADALNPDACVTVCYADGSIANVTYVTLGHIGRGKEYFELFGNSRAVTVDDYRSLQTFGCRASAGRRSRGDKGQEAAMAEFIATAREGRAAAGADAVAGLRATAIAEAAVRSGIEGRTVSLRELLEPGS